MNLVNVKGNTYYIETKLSCIPVYMINEKDAVMLDSGLFDSDAPLIEELIRDKGLRIRAVICSHAHIDHIGNNFWLQERYNTEIIMPECEAYTCCSMYNLKAYSCHPISAKTQKRYESMICTTDRYIRQEDEYMMVDGVRFEIVKLYGHSFYHVGIITPDNVFYVGDAVMSKDVMAETKIAYVADLKEDIKTKNKLKNIVCDSYIIAHKGVFDSIGGTIEDNIAYLENQLELMLSSVDRPMTESDAFTKICHKLDISRRVNQYLLAEMMIRPYLQELIDNGLLGLDLVDGMLKYVPVRHCAI